MVCTVRRLSTSLQAWLAVCYRKGEWVMNGIIFAVLFPFAAAVLCWFLFRNRKGKNDIAAVTMLLVSAVETAAVTVPLLKNIHATLAEQIPHEMYFLLSDKRYICAAAQTPPHMQITGPLCISSLQLQRKPAWIPAYVFFCFLFFLIPCLPSRYHFS